MWNKGKLTYRWKQVDYLAKVSDEPSPDGIDRGRVYNLDISIGEETIVSYDRGWEICPETAEQEGILEEVLNILTEN